MVGESDRNVFLIQIDASNFAEFEISEFEISRVDCSAKVLASIYFVEETIALESPFSPLEDQCYIFKQFRSRLEGLRKNRLC